MNQYANIIVDITHEKLDRTFQYKIPPSLQTEIEAGVRVWIPFGMGNRLIKGYVVETTDINEFPVEKMKEIQSIVSGSVSMESKLIALAWWMKENYGGTMNQALKTVLPVKREVQGIQKKTVRLLWSKEQVEQYLAENREKKNQKARIKLLQAFYEKMQYERQQSITNSNDMQVQNAVQNQDAVQTQDAVQNQNIVQTQDAVQNQNIVQTQDAMQKQNAMQTQDAVQLHQQNDNKDKQVQPHIHMIMSMEEVSGKWNISTATLKAMEQAGMIVIETEGIYRNPIQIKGQHYEPVVLNDVQQQIADKIKQKLGTDNPGVHYIHGVTGSGKTEVYMDIMEQVISEGRQVILLIPEISLTYQMVMRFYAKFGEKISILNSKMSQGERFDQFERAKNGEIQLMIGPRSALFTPFSNVGLIIIDEEHENAYKSENIPKYHAREVAIERARQYNALVVLGSATPSVDAYYKAQNGEYYLYEMNRRANDADLPQVHTVDLREELRNGNKSIFSTMLQEKMQQCIEKKQQMMMFLNRRGFAGFVSCRSCGEAIKCPHCDVSYTLHKNGNLVCHYCGHTISMPKTCPACQSKYIASFGIGTQKVEEMVKDLFPQARVLRMDMDTTSKKGAHEKILASFAKHEADILIGTQMIVKGHDFPKVTLVGVLAADLSLHSNDYHAAERTFQLVTQAAGRAGRGAYAGEVVIQTYKPEHYAIQMAATQNYKEFYEQEIAYRRLMHYPPTSNLMAILVTAGQEKEAEQFIQQLGHWMEQNCPKEMQLIGPAPAGISKIKDQYRKVLYCKGLNYDILVTAKNLAEIQMKKMELYARVMVQFDFNPTGSY